MGSHTHIYTYIYHTAYSTRTKNANGRHKSSENCKECINMQMELKLTQNRAGEMISLECDSLKRNRQIAYIESKKKNVAVIQFSGALEPSCWPCATTLFCLHFPFSFWHVEVMSASLLENPSLRGSGVIFKKKNSMVFVMICMYCT